MYNPFKEKPEDVQDDSKLIRQALEGSQEDLEKVILRHQAWIYNIALKMVSNSNDAEDVTQEILIKMITKLSTYDSEKSSFRTWLYRITANHVINIKKKKDKVSFSSSQCMHGYPEFENAIPDERPASYPGRHILINEAKTRCLNGILLCLDRRQRIAFILGSIFRVSGSVGSNILEISHPHYRKILSRSRKKLYNFLHQNCGLINEKRSCHCSKKIDSQIRLGLIDPDNLLSEHKCLGSISDILNEKVRDLDSIYYDEYIRLFREQPFYEPPNQIEWIRHTLEKEDFKNILHLN